MANTDPPPGDPTVDLERVLWDLEYRRDMIRRLAREARTAPETKE